MDTPPRSPLWWVPNALTIGRVILVAPVMAGLLSADPAGKTVALAVFCLCIVTDYFDGVIARKLNVTSDFGRMLDPIADKILIAGTLIALSIYFWERIPFPGIMPAIAIILLMRDFIVSGARELAAHKGRTMPPLKLAKWKTALEMIGIVAILASLLAVWDTGGHVIAMALSHAGLAILIIATLMSLYTGQIYVRRALAR